MHPSVRNDTDKIVWGHRLGNRHCEFHQMLIHIWPRIFFTEQELVVEQNVFSIAVLDNDPKALCTAMNGIIPFKVWCNCELNSNHRPCHRLNLCLHVKSWEF